MIGKEIRKHRLLKGYSQSYMSYCLEISQNAYSKIELGQTEITVARLQQIAEVLDTCIHSLLDPTFERHRPSIKKTSSTPAEQLEDIVDAFWQAHDKGGSRHL